MTAEVMRPPGTPQKLEGGYKPPLLVPASPVLHIPFEEQRPRPVEFQLPLQKDISERLIHLFGPDYTPAVALRGLRERGRLLSDAIEGIAQEAIDSGNLTMEQLSAIGDRTACLRITAGVAATKYGIDLQGHIDRKLLHKMQIKYRPDDVTEVRFYGTPEDPRQMTGPEAMAALKKTYDKETGTQSYRYRGLVIPRDEEDARDTAFPRFRDPYQDLASWWQTRALGSNLVPSERVVNLIGEGGEVEEVLAEFEGMTIDQINALSRDYVADLKLLESVGDELADVFIGSWCADAALGIDSEVKDRERMEIAVEKYGDGPRLRKAGYGLDRRLKHMDERYKREKMGLKAPDPLPTIVWESKHRRKDKVSHEAGDVNRAHAA